MWILCFIQVVCFISFHATHTQTHNNWDSLMMIYQADLHRDVRSLSEVYSKGKGKVQYSTMKRRRVLISLFRSWARRDGNHILMSVTRGQCDARPTVTFLAARHHCPLIGWYQIILLADRHVFVNNLPSCTRQRGVQDLNLRPKVTAR